MAEAIDHRPYFCMLALHSIEKIIMETRLNKYT